MSINDTTKKTDRLKDSLVKLYRELIESHPHPGYEPRYREAAKGLEVYFYSGGYKTKGLLNGWSPKEIVKMYRGLSRCNCGGLPVVIQTEIMGDFGFCIKCSACNRRIYRTMNDCNKPGEYENLCIADWNAGLQRAANKHL